MKTFHRMLQIIALLAFQGSIVVSADESTSLRKSRRQHKVNKMKENQTKVSSDKINMNIRTVIKKHDNNNDESCTPVEILRADLVEMGVPENLVNGASGLQICTTMFMYIDICKDRLCCCDSKNNKDNGSKDSDPILVATMDTTQIDRDLLLEVGSRLQEASSSFALNPFLSTLSIALATVAGFLFF